VSRRPVYIYVHLLLLPLGPEAVAPVSTAAIQAYFTNPVLEAPPCTARSPHAYDDARDTQQGKRELKARNGR
jgi:hypothetical protein